MRKFLKHILKILTLFSIILGCLFLINNFLLSKSLVLSENQKILFNPKYSQSIIDFKLKNYKRKVSIIGTSRTAGFEKSMFYSQSVYNYSMTVNSINDIFSLIKELKLKKNDTLIIGIDQWNFNKNYQPRLKNSFNKNRLNFPFTLFDEIKSLDSLTLIGENAINNFSGFKNDGSYFYGKRFIIPKNELEDFNFEDTYSRINAGNKRFEFGSEIDFKQIKKLEEILAFCKKKDVKVFCFFPPFAPSIFKKINNSLNYKYLNIASTEIKKIFDFYNYTFKDFSGLNTFDDTYYLDGFHCNRNVYYEILKNLNIPTNQFFDNDFEINKNELLLIEKYFNKQSAN